MSENFPRLLVVSNECLSNVSSNGRTLKNFLVGIPKEKIHQFCTRNNNPDFDVCSSFYFVSDRDALKAFKTGKKVGCILEENQQSNIGASAADGEKIQRNAVTMLARELVWNSKRWCKNEFKNWILDFSPQVILFQAGDSAFMFKIAAKLSKKLNIPLVIYNSEGYYFKKYNYFRSTGFSNFIYPVFHRYFCKQFKKTMQIAKKTVYCCKALKDDYDKEFNLPSEVIYTATEITPSSQPKTEHPALRVSYIGNMGVGRHTSLIDIAQILQKIDPSNRLDVYGKIPNDEVKQAFENCSGINYKGFVDYSKVVDVMYSSDILVHIECFDSFYREDSKYAFSTKIADSLGCGTCLLVYAPENLAVSKYLKENDAAYVVSSKAELEAVLESLCKDKEARERFLNNAAETVKKNHSAAKNAKQFQDILLDAVKG